MLHLSVKPQLSKITEKYEIHHVLKQHIVRESVSLTLITLVIIVIISTDSTQIKTSKQFKHF